MSGIIFVYVTCPDQATAEKIASIALTKRLAACANILPQMQSMYWWNGKIETAHEVVLILKTKKGLFQDLRVLITNEHPYDVPCILSWDISLGHQPYLNWLNKETT